MNADNILLIFLGSVLTFLATILVEAIKYYLSKRSKRQSFILIVSQQIKGMLKTLESLKVALEQKGFFDYKLLDLLTSELDELKKYKDRSINLHSKESQEKFIDQLSKLTILFAEAKSIQDFCYDEQQNIAKGTPKTFQDKAALDAYFANQKTLKTVEFLEAKRELESLVKEMS